MIEDSLGIFLTVAGELLSAVWAVVLPALQGIWSGFQAVIGPFLAAAAAAYLGFKSWRRQRWIERRSELAERTLANFYEAQEAFRHARSPFIFVSEGQTRTWKAPAETEEMAGRLDAYYAPVERLEKYQEVFARLQASRYQAMALFGPESRAPFDTINKTYQTIIRSARFLIGHAGQEWPDRDSQKRLTDEWQRNIGWPDSDGDEDKLADEIDKAIDDIERICRPFVELIEP